ncbi:Protein of unknown function [Pyronema omphalodes CBS 100304]|uniref:Uncharacterized protein n=1 Tax=Pyronema omphalodes (strain CBS 100304) TaxID=1076935 RepID=U4LW22_PYROM|nr:Protein of unknown function [Pyronema omphalodes CBS 100304]
MSDDSIYRPLSPPIPLSRRSPSPEIPTDFTPPFLPMTSAFQIFSIFSKNFRSENFVDLIGRLVTTKFYHTSHHACLWAIFAVLYYFLRRGDAFTRDIHDEDVKAESKHLDAQNPTADSPADVRPVILKLFLFKDQGGWDKERHAEFTKKLRQGKWRNPGESYFKAAKQNYGESWTHQATWDFFHLLAGMEMEEMRGFYDRVRRLLMFWVGELQLPVGEGKEKDPDIQGCVLMRGKGDEEKVLLEAEEIVRIITESFEKLPEKYRTGSLFNI